MKKFSKNLIVRSKAGRAELLQTGPDFTYIEELPNFNFNEDFQVCVDAEKFLSIFDESTSVLAFYDDYLEVKTKKTVVKLAYMKEYGEFKADPEILFNELIINFFKYDFSKAPIELEEALGNYAYVLFNENFVARYLRNTLEYFGQLSENYYSITPAQYKMLKLLGNCNVEVGDSLICASCDNVKFIFKRYQNLLNLKLIDRFFNAPDLLEFTAPQINLKTLKLFLKDALDIKLIRKDNQLILESLDISDAYDISDYSNDYKLVAKIHKDDIENLDGLVKVREFNGFLYFIAYSEKLNRTVLFMSKEK